MVKSGKKIFTKTIVFSFSICIALLLLILLLNSNVLDFYLNGIGLKKPVFSTYSRVVLWNSPKLLDGDVNNLAGNREITLSKDRKTMIIVRYYDVDNKDLFISRKIYGKWTKPVRMKTVNSDYNEITPMLSNDGNYLFFASDRPGGKGGFDIWVSEKNHGLWQEPYQISNGVNTEYDEESPYLTVDKQVFYFNSNRPDQSLDNPRLDSRTKYFDIYSLYVENIFENEDASSFFSFKTLKKLNSINSEYDEGRITATSRGNIVYFSSNRPGGMGGYDIYRSYLLNEGYTKPENIGNIINSKRDEISPIISGDGYELYFESNKSSWDKLDFRILKSESAEVIKKFNFGLMFDFLSIILLLLIIGMIIWLLLKILAKKTDMSLIVKCLIIAIILHLLIALLSGIWYLGGKVQEVVKDKQKDITININTLARESVALSVREGIASLPKVKAVSTTNKPVEKVAVPQQQPITSSEVSEVWQDSEVVKAPSSPVNVKKTIPSESTADFASDNDKISDVKPMKFGSSQVAMEVPEGTGNQASAPDAGKASGLPQAVKPTYKTEKEQSTDIKNMEPIFTADITEIYEITPTSMNVNAKDTNINKSLAKTNIYERATNSPTLETNFASNKDIEGLYEDVSDFEGDDREVDGLAGMEGGFLIESNFMMSSPRDKANKTNKDFEFRKNNKDYSTKIWRGYDYGDILEFDPVEIGYAKYVKLIMKFKNFIMEPIMLERLFSEPIGDEIYEKTPDFMIDIDNELEVPEEYLQN